MPPKTRLLIHSNAPYAPTGYGNQVGLFAPLLNETYDVGISCFYGLEGNTLRWKGIPLLPGLGGEFGNEYIVDHARTFFDDDPRGGIFLTLMDVWVLQAEKVAELNACCWVPVDHNPAPPLVQAFFNESGAVPLAMSRFGEERLQDYSPLYVPHGVDTKAYAPTDRVKMREHFDLDPEAFIVGMVAANKGAPSRKGFQQAFLAFRHFLEKHENALLYLHTNMRGDWSQGEDLPTMIKSLEIPEDKVFIANQYRVNFAPAPARMMMGLYNCFDVLLNPAMGEGFGLPIMEAQACGVPAIVTDFSAMKEVCGSGWKVPWTDYWTGQKAWQAMPDVGAIVQSLEECHDMKPELRKKMSADARKHALKYAAPKVLKEHFLPALAEVEKRFAPKAPAVPTKVVTG